MIEIYKISGDDPTGLWIYLIFLVDFFLYEEDDTGSAIYIIKQDIRIYMLPIAGQAAEPNGLKFFVDTFWGGQGVF